MYREQYYDSATGDYYLKARNYDAATGRFTQEDPAFDGTNWYVYCGNNPVSRYDPNGQNWIYNVWNWGEDTVWKGIALGINAVGWQLTSDLLWLAASGSGNTYAAMAGSYASNLAKNDAGINKFVNDIIWAYGTSQNNSNPLIPTQSYEIPLSNGDLGAALHNVYVDIKASRGSDGVWTATVTLTDTFDFTECKNPFKQDSALKGLLWLANDIAYFDTEWGLLDPVGVSITYKKNY